jgi:hypothetical protein
MTTTIELTCCRSHQRICIAFEGTGLTGRWAYSRLIAIPEVLGMVEACGGSITLQGSDQRTAKAYDIPPACGQTDSHTDQPSSAAEQPQSSPDHSDCH